MEGVEEDEVDNAVGRKDEPSAPLYQALDRSTHEIRLLTLQSSQDRNAPIECTFENVSLDKDVEYDALSYTWGHSSERRAIYLRSTRVDVTDNLYAALQQFRVSAVLERPIWVDAVCINQHEHSEKNHQVALMGRIYKKATKVHIWLGPSGLNTAAAFEKIRNVIRNGFSTESLEKFLRAEDEYQWSGLLDLATRRWWRRRWVFQEARLATLPVAHCGSNSIPFGDLLRLFDKLSIVTNSILSSKTARACILQVLENGLTFFNGDAYESTQEAGYWHTERLSTLFSRTQQLETSDPRDSVYALMGLLPRDLQIEPDYDAPIMVTFERFALRLMEWTHSLDLLGDSCTDKPSSEFSWAPYFPTIRAYHQRSSPTQTMRGSLFANPLSSGKLMVRAVVFDEVAVVGKRVKHYSKNKLYPVLSWWKLGQDSPVSQPSSLDRDRMFWHTLSRGKFWNGFPDKVAGLLKEIVYEDKLFQSCDQQVLEELHQSLETLNLRDDDTFFITKKGFLGLGKGIVEVKDKVGVLAGSDKLFTLRYINGGVLSYKLTSDCWIEGKMEGVAVAHKLDQEFPGLVDEYLGTAALESVEGSVRDLLRGEDFGGAELLKATRLQAFIEGHNFDDSLDIKEAISTGEWVHILLTSLSQITTADQPQYGRYTALTLMHELCMEWWRVLMHRGSRLVDMQALDSRNGNVRDYEMQRSYEMLRVVCIAFGHAQGDADSANRGCRPATFHGWSVHIVASVLGITLARLVHDAQLRPSAVGTALESLDSYLAIVTEYIEVYSTVMKEEKDLKRKRDLQEKVDSLFKAVVLV